jgi:hypothetical protein
VEKIIADAAAKIAAANFTFKATDQQVMSEAKTALAVERAAAERKALREHEARLDAEEKARDQERLKAAQSAFDAEVLTIKAANAATEKAFKEKKKAKIFQGVRAWADDDLLVLASSEEDFKGFTAQYVAAGVRPLANQVHSLSAHVNAEQDGPLVTVLVPSLAPMQVTSNWQRGAHSLPSLDQVRCAL